MHRRLSWIDAVPLTGRVSVITQPGAVRDAASLSARRERWREQLAEYDGDPAAWMRSYFQRMLISHAELRGDAAARAFGAKLITQGLVAAKDVDQALGGENSPNE